MFLFTDTYGAIIFTILPNNISKEGYSYLSVCLSVHLYASNEIAGQISLQISMNIMPLKATPKLIFFNFIKSVTMWLEARIV